VTEALAERAGPQSRVKSLRRRRGLRHRPPSRSI
jgi:hypothetical protein